MRNPSPKHNHYTTLIKSEKNYHSKYWGNAQLKMVINTNTKILLGRKPPTKEINWLASYFANISITQLAAQGIQQKEYQTLSFFFS